MMMLKLTCLLIMTSHGISAQTNAQTELPKVPEPTHINIRYTKNAGNGKISAANRKGTVNQWLEVWESDAKTANVVTYVIAGDGVSFTATWGRGRVNPKVFNCSATETPEFTDNDVWVATVSFRNVSFTKITDDDVEGLFVNLNRIRSDLAPEGLVMAKGSYASIGQTNILGFMKEKNRKKWLTSGWLQPANTCMRHF